MASETNGNESYVVRIWEETRRHTRELLEENGRLRELAARLEEDRQRLAEEAGAAAAAEATVASLRARIAEVEMMAESAVGHAQFLEHQVWGYRTRRDELERKLESLEQESRQRLESYIDLEAQNTNLANLYVASYRLHSTLDRREVLAGIQEIIINLIGSEELAVFESGNGEETPRLAASFGLEFGSFEEFPPEARQAIERCLRTREIAIGEADESDFRPTACIPLRVDERVIGAIAVFRLLQQKQGIESIDRELFDLLATHAATALYASSMDPSRRMEVA